MLNVFIPCKAFCMSLYPPVQIVVYIVTYSETLDSRTQDANTIKLVSTKKNIDTHTRLGF